MALVVADRVKETTTTTGTGTLTLDGAPTGFQPFSVIGNGNTTYYAISSSGGTEWEVGIGTYTSSGTTLARTTILASSNSGSAVNLSAGTKDVYVTYPAGKSVNLDSSGNATALGTLASATLTNATGLPLTTGVTGTLPVANGGTGATSLTANNVILGNGTSAVQVVAPSTSGNVLTSNGTTWASSAIPGSGVTTYSNITTATTYTLTSASNATIEIDAQAFGIKVVLPNATTLSARGSAYLIRNVGNYPILIEDSTNVAIGGVPASLQVQVGLNSTATAAGSWILDENACFSTEVSQVKTAFTGTLANQIIRIIRFSSTKFAIISPASGFTVAIQGFSVSGDAITAGTLTGVSAAGTYVEAREVSGNRVLVTVRSTTNLSSYIVDLSDIASPVVGSAATISSTMFNGDAVAFFDQKPVNDIYAFEASFTRSGNLTGTNIYVYLYRSTTTGQYQGNSIDVGSSGTTGTVGTEYSTGALGITNSFIVLGANVISASTIGYSIIFNSATLGTCYAFTAEITGGVWSANSNNFYTASASLASSTSMRYSSRAIIFATRTTNNGLYAIEFPASGNAAPTTLRVNYGAALSNPGQIGLTASRIVVTFATSGGLNTFEYVFGTSLTSDEFAYTGEVAIAFKGTIDTTTCNTFSTTTTSNSNNIVYVAANVLSYKKISTTGNFATLNGFLNSATNFLGIVAITDNAKIMRGTTNTTPNFVPNKNYGTSRFGTAVTFSARYFFNLGKFLVFWYSGYGMTVVPVSASTTNGFLGSSGFKDFQLTSANVMDLDSSRAIYTQTATSLDSGVSEIADLTLGAADVRISLLRIANV